MAGCGKGEWGASTGLEKRCYGCIQAGGIQQTAKRPKNNSTEAEVMYPAMSLSAPITISQNFYEDFPLVFNDVALYGSDISESCDYHVPFIVLRTKNA